MKKIGIFDLTMFCPTDVCVPIVDLELTRIAFAVYVIEKKGYLIKR
ncbi:arsenic metallochaperone ArsD family protein [Thermaerobacillus caldiproteolyticus]|nr:arsenic metallochaperone ArsD family protein [Anoxybacillus caldiproteolyticus]